ncbi:MAG: hypothetical protein MUF24_12540 [Chitinophagaceae bacterium]|nr:hypothetical protein [Chitinophagaceae bacterium]
MRTIYGVLTWLMLLWSVLLSILGIFFLLAALGNFKALLPLFMVVATLLYILFSFEFYQKGLRYNQPFRPERKDWIKVNAFVALAWSILLIGQAVYFWMQPSLINDFLVQFENMMKELGNPEGVKQVNLRQIVNYSLGFSAGIGLVKLTHVIMTLIFIKKRPDLFTLGRA